MELQEVSNKDLIIICKELDIKCYSGKNKQELIDMIKSYEKQINSRKFNKKTLIENYNKILSNFICITRPPITLYDCERYSIINMDLRYLLDNAIDQTYISFSEKGSLNKKDTLSILKSQKEYLEKGFVEFYNPIILASYDDKYFVVDGNRRLWALKEYTDNSVSIITHVYKYNDDEVNELYCQIHDLKPSIDKKSIPKQMRIDLWENYFGDMRIGKCFCCDKKLNYDHFEAGHVMSKSSGGCNTLSNLRIVCKVCNRDMGIQNMMEYKKKFK